MTLDRPLENPYKTRGYERKTVQEPTIYLSGPLCKSLINKGFLRRLQSDGPCCIIMVLNEGRTLTQTQQDCHRHQVGTYPCEQPVY